MWRFLTGSYGRFCKEDLHPGRGSLLYIYKRGGREWKTHTHLTSHSPQGILTYSIGLVEFRRSLGVIESPELFRSSGLGSSLVLSYNIRQFVIELDYGYQYLLEVCFELSDICFLICVAHLGR